MSYLEKASVILMLWAKSFIFVPLTMLIQGLNRAAKGAKDLLPHFNTWCTEIKAIRFAAFCEIKAAGIKHETFNHQQVMVLPNCPTLVICWQLVDSALATLRPTRDFKEKSFFKL